MSVKLPGMYTDLPALEYVTAWARMATQEEKQELSVRLGVWGGVWITKNVVQTLARLSRDTVARRHRKVARRGTEAKMKPGTQNSPEGL